MKLIAESRNEKLLSFDNFLEKFKELNIYPNKRYVAEGFERFACYNKDALDFLDAYIAVPSKSQGQRQLVTGKFGGCVPLRSPYTGLTAGVLEVKPRYADMDDIVGILPLLENTFHPVFKPEWTLIETVQLKAPVVLECVNYLQLFREALKKPWHKFQAVTQLQTRPNSGTDWNEYALRSHDPSQSLIYSNHNNIQSVDHPQWRELTYVLKIALHEVEPYSNLSLDSFLKEHLSRYITTHPQLLTTHIKEINSDPPNIKQLKQLANRILLNNSSQNCAWRVNLEEFFERFCQYICQKAAQKRGAEMSCNLHLDIRGFHAPWRLRYLEPDIVLRLGKRTVVIDAKYKSHLFNLSKESDKLKEDFRHDLHQILAYSGLCDTESTDAILLYPWEGKQQKDDTSEGGNKIHKTLKVSRLNGTKLTVHLLSVPINKQAIDPTAHAIAKIVAD